MDDAAEAVTAFWGPDWPRDILIVAAGSDAQFGSLAGGGPDIAATTTAERIMFAPGAAAMSDAALRIVLRHELFHFAARADTAADAPRWLTEGVADFVGRPPTPPAPGRRGAGATAHRRRPDTPGAAGRWPTTGPGGSAGSSPTLRHRHAAGAVPAGVRSGPSRRRHRRARHPWRGPAKVLAGWRHWLSG